MSAPPAPLEGLDPRVHAWRPDLADAALAGRAHAARFAPAIAQRCWFERASVRVAPDHGARACSELLIGEDFHVIETADGWAWGWCGHDHYVGYVRAAELEADDRAPTHRVTARTALIFAEPDIKAPVLARPPLGGRLALVPAGEAFFAAAALGFIHCRHVAPIAAHAADPVAVAARLIGAPYLWGGRSGEGVDCSGLVQLALGMSGVAAPRDSDQQAAALGAAVDPATPPMRGDLVFFPGHVGWMTGPADLLHANAHWMAVVEEPLADVVARLRAAGHARPISAVRRLALPVAP